MKKETLASDAKELLANYFPPQGDIQVVLAVAVGDQEYIVTFRRQEDTGTPAADEHTIFEIGSVTMVFTACLLADMAIKHEVRLGDPIQRYLPADVRVPSYRGQEITLLDLGNHTSALPRLPTNFPETIKDPADPCRDYTVGHLHDFLNTFQLRRPIGWRRYFSNLGMGLLGHVLSLAVKKDLPELIRERISTLGMPDTAVSLTAEQQMRFIQGHSVSGQPVKPWDMGALIGAGGLRSTARDLLTFVQTRRLKTGQVRDAIEMISTPRPKSGRHPPWPLAIGSALGMGALALAALWYFPIMPATGWFVPCFFTPVLLAGLYGGLWPALSATVALTAGACLLFGEAFNAPMHAAACLVIAWFASANDRKRRRPETLGWEHQRKGGGECTLWQTGETGGHAAFVGFQKDGDVALVVLANCAKPLAPLGFGIFWTLQYCLAKERK